MKNSGIALRAAYSLAGLRDAWRRERSFRLADLVEPRRHPLVRIVKDMASAAAFLVNCATGLAAILLVIAEW